ncbi:unnamed protein product [Schistosoma curassoni]|uniref:Uncharacterized protein n=1 Tax=Schistosoma curassoni TaxID=6186 RepID=A0A3P8IFU6_9TREM|nr:unnamed protein product [Schistosoma curassoni]
MSFFQGGVPGDITVILGLVIEEKPSPTSNHVKETRSSLNHHHLLFQPNRSLSCFELNYNKFHSFISSSSTLPTSSASTNTAKSFSSKLSRTYSCT